MSLQQKAQEFLQAKTTRKAFIFKKFIEPHLPELAIENLYRDNGTYNTYDGRLTPQQKLYICQRLAKGEFNFSVPICPSCKKFIRQDPFVETSICSSKSKECYRWLMKIKNQQLKQKQSHKENIEKAIQRIFQNYSLKEIAENRLVNDKAGYFSSALVYGITNGKIVVKDLPDNWLSIKNYVTKWVAEKLLNNEALVWPKCPVCGKPLPNPLGKYCSNKCSAVSKSIKKELLQETFTTESHFSKILDSNRVEYVSQKHIGSYVVDFFIPKWNMVVEIDGFHHLGSYMGCKDLEKQQKLKEMGYNVIRIPFYIPLTQKFLDAYFGSRKLKPLTNKIDWLGFKHVTSDIWICGGNALRFILDLKFLVSNNLIDETLTILESAMKHPRVILDSIFLKYQPHEIIRNLDFFESYFRIYC